MPLNQNTSIVILCRSVVLSLMVSVILSCGGGGGDNGAANDTGNGQTTSTEGYRLVVLGFDQNALISPVTGMVPGSTIQFTALGETASGNRSDISGKVTWNTDNAGIISIDASGKATAVAVGKARITASQKDGDQSISLTQLVEVKDVTITITPATAVPVFEGEKVRVSATAVAADNSSFNLGSVLNWQSSDTSVATIDNTGLITILSSGTTSIRVTFFNIESNYELRSYKPFTLSATVKGLNEVQLNWNSVGVDQYTITKKSTYAPVSETANTPVTSTIQGVTTNGYVDAGLNLSVRYAYQISTRGVTSNEVIIDLPSNNSGILSGVPVGKGLELGNGSWQRKPVAVSVGTIDPILELKSAEILFSPLSRYSATLLIQLHNKSDWADSCMTQGESIALLDSAGNLIQGMKMLGANIFMHGTKVRSWGGYTDTCFGPKQSAYLVGYIFDDPIAVAGADFSLIDRVNIQSIYRRINTTEVSAAVIPEAYRVIAGAMPEADQTLEVDVKNLGVVDVEAQYAQVTLYDIQDQPIYVKTLYTPADTKGLIVPGMTTTLSGKISFDGLVNRMLVQVTIRAPSAPAQ